MLIVETREAKVKIRRDGKAIFLTVLRGDVPDSASAFLENWHLETFVAAVNAIAAEIKQENQSGSDQRKVD